MSGSITGRQIYAVDHTSLEGGAAGTAEVSAYDAARGLVFILGAGGVDALDLQTGALRFSLAGADVLTAPSAGGTSVAVHGDLLAVSYEGAEDGVKGTVALYTLAADGTGAAFVASISVGATPDQISFTPDGRRLLVAIEAEPNTNYTDNDPAGTLGDAPGGVMVINTDAGSEGYLDAEFLGFEGFDAGTLRAAGVRIKEGATAAADLEPEYIVTSADGTRAYVAMQENNAIGVLDLTTNNWLGVYGLGYKDHSVEGNGIDPSNEDGGIDIRTVPVRGLYMPDGMASFEMGGKTYLVTANEGDAREYDAYEDVARVKDLVLDETAFGGAEAVALLQQDENLGRLNVSAVDGDIDGDGDIDVLYSLGARSMSIWEASDTGITQVWDSGDMLEQILAADFEDLLDDGRSDDKGPEPESVKLATVNGDLYAFLALERSDAMMMFRIDAPDQVSYAGTVATGGDAPEVIGIIADAFGGPILISPNEGDGVTTAIRLTIPLHGDGEGNTLRGTTGDDMLFGGAGNDLLIGSIGQDRLDGGEGFDVLVFEGLTRGDVAFERDEDGGIEAVTWTDAAGSHRTAVTGMESIRFLDGSIEFSGQTAAAAVEGLYRGLLGREGDLEGRSFWLERVEAGGSFVEIADSMLASEEGESALLLSDAGFLAQFYDAVLGREADAAGLAFWTAALAGGSSRAEIAAGFVTSNEARGLSVEAGLAIADLDSAWIGWSFAALLGRDIDLAGLASFRGAAEHVGRVTLLEGMTASLEFRNGLGALGDAGFVAGLFQSALGRAADAEGLAFFVAALEDGASRAEVAAEILGSAEARPFYLAMVETGVALI